MNPRERVITALSRQVPDKVPKDLGFGLTPHMLDVFRSKTGQEWPDDYFKSDIRMVPMPDAAYRYDYSKYYENRDDIDGLRIDEWGIGYIKSKHRDWHYEHIISPLSGERSLNDIIDYPLYETVDENRYQFIKEFTQKLHDMELAAAAPLASTNYEIAWQIRGISDFLIDMALREDYAECLLDRIADIRKKSAVKYVNAGVDVLMLGEDIADQRGMIMSMDMWRRFLKPRMAEIIAEVKRINPKLIVFYHSDGNVEQAIPELIEIGVDVLNPVQPECMDPARIKLLYGDKLAFWGTVGVQSTLPFGDRTEIRRVVKERIKTVGKDGGLLISPAHMIAPEVPWENVVALYEAIEEYGYYR